MFGRSWRVGTIGGVPVNVDSSWIWIAVLLTYTLWARYRVEFGASTGSAIALALFAATLFFGSVFLHEGAHAVAARANGIEVFGITLVVFGGYTSARSDEKGPGPAFVISAVGPATSLVLGAIFWALANATESTRPFSAALASVGFVNLLMGVFNFLPGLPLDGGRMLEAAVWRFTHNRDRGTGIAAWVGMAIGVLSAAAAVFELSSGNVAGGIFLFIIAMFIFQGARAADSSITMRRRLTQATVADVMDPPPPVVPANMSLSEALDRYLRGHESEAFPVIDDGHVLGMLTFDSAREVGMHDPLRPVRDAVVPLSDVLTAEASERLDQVAARLGTGRAALVLRDGQLVGAITGGGLARWAAGRR